MHLKLKSAFPVVPATRFWSLGIEDLGHVTLLRPLCRRRLCNSPPTPRWVPSGGCARGVSAQCFETPLAGGAAAAMGASAVCWRTACQRRGGNPPAPAFPWRGKRERGRLDVLA